MVDQSSPAGVVDAVWAAANDGRWHTRRRIAEELPFDAEEVTAALDFLVRYGFAESRLVGEKRFRMIMGSPSPMEAADMLRFLGLPAS